LLHESSENINDEALLMTIKEILERQHIPKAAIKLTDWQINRMEQSKQQIKEGISYSEKEADDIIEEWLNQ
jgi:hypothetical protein